MTRNVCTRFAALIAVLLVSLASSRAIAQGASGFPPGYPDRPLRVIVTTVAGGGIDIITRPVMERLSQRLGKPILVENRSGANGLIGTNFVADAAADGTTLLSTGDSLVMNGVLKRFPYDVRQVFAPLAQLSVQDYLVFSHPALPVSNFRELLDYARRNPGKLNFGSAGTGSVGHLGLELIKSRTGVSIVHIPYKGNAPAALDLAAGQIQLLFSNIAGVQMVRSGKARVIGVMTPKRMPAYPDIPTVAESGVPGFELRNTYCLYVLAKTSPQTVSALNREILQILTAPEIRERYAVDSSEVAPPHSPDELRRLLNAEFEKWDAIAKIANIKADTP